MLTKYYGYGGGGGHHREENPGGHGDGGDQWRDRVVQKNDMGLNPKRKG